MAINLSIYKNTTPLGTLNGVPVYMADMADAALRGRLNTFLLGDTGSGKTQLAREIRGYFGDKSLFFLGRNDMDTREVFQQINPEFVRAIRQGNATGARFKELSDAVKSHYIVVDELPNFVAAVRAQLFNLFDGFIEIGGRAYPIGSGYSVGFATGNLGQQFTESSNDLGRALKDRMHLIIDVDYFRPQPIDTLDMLMADRNPRVDLCDRVSDKSDEIIALHKRLMQREVPFEKYVIAQYLIHGLDYIEGGKSKIAMKSGWPNKLEGHEAGSDAALVLPVSPRAAKSIITLSEALDEIAQEKGEAPEENKSGCLDSMMFAFKFAGAYSGILNEAMVRQKYEEDRYAAMQAVIDATKAQFTGKQDAISAGLGLAAQGKTSEKVSRQFNGRWEFMKKLLNSIAERQKNQR